MTGESSERNNDTNLFLAAIALATHYGSREQEMESFQPATS